MKTLSVAFLFLCLIFLPFTISAEVKTFTHEVKQPFSGSQSPDDARVAATQKAKREVLEKAGTYLESLRIVERGRLKKDQVLALASGVLKTEIVSQKPYVTGEGYGIIIKVKVDVDTSMLEDRVTKLMTDRTAMEQLTANRKREKELLAKVQQLEEENRRLAKQKVTPLVKEEKEELKKAFKQTTKGLDAVALTNEAIRLWKRGKYTNAKKPIRLLNEAIELDPTYAFGYLNRGAIHENIKQYARAIQDYDKAIELDPNYAEAYEYRGVSYSLLRQHARAIQDYDKAIELDPNYAKAYDSRGATYSHLGQHTRALTDYGKAIELDPTRAYAYLNRGSAYNILKQYKRAFKDFNKAIALNPSLAMAYDGRGFVYYQFRHYARAIQDYDRALELDPNYAISYNNRGFAYHALGKYYQACADLKRSCDLRNCNGWEWAIKNGVCR